MASKKQIKHFFEKFKLDILLYALHCLSIFLAFKVDFFKQLVWFLILLIWLPVYYSHQHSKISDVNSAFNGDRFWASVFTLPLIGPIIAIIRINYLQDEIENEEKINNPISH